MCSESGSLEPPYVSHLSLCIVLADVLIVSIALHHQLFVTFGESLSIPEVPVWS